MAASRIVISEAARQVIDRLIAQHGPLIFHQSGGCCDGSAPMCYLQGEFLIGDQDVMLGEVHGCPFYMSAFQFEYWKHTQLELDVTKGRGASFSAEIPLGLRFVIKSRLFTDEEWADLEPVRLG
ncbi:MAG: DUF779 domain-containing protein [Lewinellaceae bacterium]|nr:DUF779 domain-containing protein [Saprospiraceae bacterium]MCB9344133.1 DUF779 domain-containing protein [Lewinellaceae bacterium]